MTPASNEFPFQLPRLAGQSWKIGRAGTAVSRKARWSVSDQSKIIEDLLTRGKQASEEHIKKLQILGVQTGSTGAGTPSAWTEIYRYLGEIDRIRQEIDDRWIAALRAAANDSDQIRAADTRRTAEHAALRDGWNIPWKEKA